jgi:hypothetical protein
MTIELIYASVFWLNTFPATDGVSDTLSPRELIVGLKIENNRHCQLEFGTYVQVHEETDNSLTSRTTGAIALRPTGNAQGGFYFYSLTSGRRLDRNRWTTLPLPADVIDRVHFLARRGRCLNGIDFLDRARQPHIAEHDVNVAMTTTGPWTPTFTLTPELIPVVTATTSQMATATLLMSSPRPTIPTTRQATLQEWMKTPTTVKHTKQTTMLPTFGSQEWQTSRLTTMILTTTDPI